MKPVCLCQEQSNDNERRPLNLVMCAGDRHCLCVRWYRCEFHQDRKWSPYWLFVMLTEVIQEEVSFTSLAIFVPKENSVGLLFFFFCFDSWRKLPSRNPSTNGKSSKLCTASGMIITCDCPRCRSSSTLSLPLRNCAACSLIWLLDNMHRWIFTGELPSEQTCW